MFFRDFRCTSKKIVKHIAFIPGVLHIGLAKISSHSSTWQFKTMKKNHPKGLLKAFI